MAPEPVYPVGLRLAGRRVVVVGGGGVALRRVAALLAAGAKVTVIASRITAALGDLADRGAVDVEHRPYEDGDLDGAWFALACTDDPAVNAAVAAEADRSRVWCVRGDDAQRSAAWVPAVGRSERLTVAVHADRDPRRAAAVRDECLAVLQRPPAPVRDHPDRPGRVVLVGGGPGDPGLITTRGRERLMAADVIVVDRLAPLALLDELPDEVEIVDAAKVPGGPAMRQAHINDVLVEQARAGRTVVRLKGGDPFVFGRGMEEVQACTAAGVPVEVVPGVSSAIAVPALAGIPVTHRGLTQGFTVVSGHVAPGGPGSTVDWAALAAARTTLVLLMAVEHLPAITAALLAGGLARDTPAACVVDGSTPRQRRIGAPLEELAATARAAQLDNPAVVVIGDVAALAGTQPDAAGQSVPAAASASRRHERARRILVLGGARSGKSATAERMLVDGERVDYVATAAGAGAVDPEWAERVRLHQERRPDGWRTAETRDLEAVLSAPPDGPGAVPVLIDCLSTWLAGVMDDCGLWAERPGADEALAVRVDGLVTAWRSTGRHVVAVSSEVGWGVVPAIASGRRFRDELGVLNARVAAECHEVWLCVAGVPWRLR
jgi:uroporphyrin-III C-methyltransferase/precorrin-2 dehydrogenase/sirohydrochlorin ferrochelatase